MTEAASEGKEASEAVKKAVIDARRPIDRLIQVVDFKPKIHRVNPAYQWAQSPDELFIEVKFSHKLNSTGCLEIYNEDVTFLEDRFKFVAFCTKSSSTRVKLQLDLDLHGKIVPENCSYTNSTAGKMAFTLAKAEREAWPQPIKGKMPKNTIEWQEMKDQYQAEMDSLGEGRVDFTIREGEETSDEEIEVEGADDMESPQHSEL